MPNNTHSSGSGKACIRCGKKYTVASGPLATITGVCTDCQNGRTSDSGYDDLESDYKSCPRCNTTTLATSDPDSLCGGCSS